ncbi:MAG: sigma-E factor negative regulatory protein [Methylophilaceae bacterium]|jgi:sigma-E factor negative regulatory protein RseA
MKNQLSALIDGEFDIEEADHLITAMKADGEMKESWEQYNLIGDAIRGDDNVRPDLTVKIMRGLDDEPTVLAVNKQLQDTIVGDSKSDTKRPVVRTPVFLSVSASVAAIMFVGLMVFELQLDNVDDMSPVEIANSLPIEYLQAHQSAAPSGAAYYIQSTSYTEPGQ